MAEADQAVLDPFTKSAPRRWFLIGAGTAILLLGQVLGAVPAALATVAFVSGVMALAHMAAVLAAGASPEWPWLEHAAAAFDVLFVGILTFFFGSGAFVVLYIPAIGPHFLNRRETFGFGVVGAAAVSYLAAALLHAALLSGEGLAGAAFLRLVLEVAALAVVAFAMQHFSAQVLDRVDAVRSLLDGARAGSLSARVRVREPDQLGDLEESGNALLAGFGATLNQVLSEAEELAVLASLFADATGHVLEASRRVEASASTLAAGLREQRTVAEFGYEQGTEAAHESEGLRDQAERVEEDAQQLVLAAVTGRSRVTRASETLLAIGHDVQRTASTIRDVRGFSKHIGTLAQSIGRIARHTHILALNAAIEAAHAGGQGRGFAVVAEQVRELAAEAGRAAKDVTKLVEELKTGIETLAEVLSSGEERVRSVGDVASEARAALDDLLQGVSQTSELVTLTAQISRSQSERMASLAEKMSQFSTMGARWSTDADSAAGAMAAQISQMGDLSQMSRRLSELADSLRTSMARFSTTNPDTDRAVDSD